MSFDKTVIALVAVLLVAAIWANWPSSKPSVEVTPAPKVEAEIIKRPVREGNCWRQFFGTNGKDSILVCG